MGSGYRNRLLEASICLRYLVKQNDNANSGNSGYLLFAGDKESESVNTKTVVIPHTLTGEAGLRRDCSGRVALPLKTFENGRRRPSKKGMGHRKDWYCFRETPELHRILASTLQSTWLRSFTNMASVRSIVKVKNQQ